MILAQRLRIEIYRKHRAFPLPILFFQLQAFCSHEYATASTASSVTITHLKRLNDGRHAHDHRVRALHGHGDWQGPADCAATGIDRESSFCGRGRHRCRTVRRISATPWPSPDTSRCSCSECT